MPLLEISQLKKAYTSPDGSTRQVIDVPDFSIETGQEVALEGPSGSGKTTFLNLIAGILKPDSGSIRVDGTDLTQLSEAQRDAFRAEKVGFVFQSFHLLDGYTALENVALGMLFGQGVDRSRARALLDRLGLGQHANHRPSQLSIGQRQRVAVARALASRPPLLLADEPTGSLDQTSAAEALGLMREVAAENSAALLLVSHDAQILGAFEHRMSLAQLNRAALQMNGSQANSSTSSNG